MSEELKGKVAIITGGGSGLGAGTARLFAAEGARVVIADIADDAGEELANELGGEAKFYHCDVSKAEDVKGLVEFAVSTFGKLDIMFNNAGIAGDMQHVDFLEDAFDDFSKVMEVDLLGVMLGCRFAGRAMAKTGGGAIINTASTAGSFAGYGIPAYRAAKAGVISITQNAAVVLGKYGIRVNAISPGPIETPIFLPGVELPEDVKAALSRELMEVMVEMQPLKRYGQPIDIANAAVFLGSDRSAQISGQDLIVAGGMGIGDNVDRLAEMNKVVARFMTPDG